MPTGEISIQEPPEVPEAARGGMRGALLFLPMMLMSGVVMVVFIGFRGVLTWIIAGLMAVAVVAMLVGQFLATGGDRKHRLAGDRRDYLRYLAQHRRRARRWVQAQREANEWRHPRVESLWSFAMTTRRWERRASHPDFLEVRIGSGSQRLATRIAPLQTKPVEDLDPLAAKSLRRFIRAYSMVEDQPVALFLPGFAHIRLTGDRDQTRAFARAILAQTATLHAPEEVMVGLCLGSEASAEWEWMKWLPHVQHPTQQDAAGQARLVADSADGLDRMLGQQFSERPRWEQGALPTREEPFVLILCDGGRVPTGSRYVTGGYRNAVVLDINGDVAASPKGALVLEVSADELVMVTHNAVDQEVRTRLASPDRLDAARARTLALLLSPYRLSIATEQVADALAANLDLPTLLGVPDLASMDVERQWQSVGAVDRLRVPIGVDAHGMPVELDIKESALGGMGPHGVLIGATGSGKSELLRTLVLAMAMRHSSETLNFILVDFKGGATFLGLDGLPHVSATITNLADEAALVERMRDALQGELVRRQELLRRAGGYTSALEYERARAQGTPLDPLPTLFVIVDEFSELISTHRDFVDLFVMIGRLGRSLAVHLLLASQRLDDGRMGQLESHLSYRIGLRTFSAMESRTVIGVPDAYELPAAPGNGYLRTDVATLIRFKAAYVSGPYRAAGTRVDQEVIERQAVPYVLDHVPHRMPIPSSAEPEPDDSPALSAATSTTPSVLSIVVDQLRDHGPPAHQVWLPPLQTPATLDQLLPGIVPTPRLGLRAEQWPGASSLVAPIGIVDRPFEQLRDLMVVDLAGVGGHLGVAGGPQSGKSTLLRTVICALALTHTPYEVQFYCLDFGGGTLSTIAGLPHVGSVTGRHDADRVSRTVTEVTELLRARERRFAALGIDSMATYRRRRAAGEITDDPYGDVFLVVDGWFTLRQEFDALENAVRAITARGLNFGIHLLLTAARWSEVHHGMRDQIGTRLELRLGDPVDSVIDLRIAATVPVVPGRGLSAQKLHFLGALPRIDSDPDPGTVTQGLQALVGAVDACWAGPPAPPIRTLPELLAADTLPAPEEGPRVVIGVDEQRIAPLWHDFGEVSHLTVLGDAQSGKSNLIRYLARSLVSRFTPDQVRILLVDYRRDLFEHVPAAYRLGYSVSQESTKDSIADAVRGLSGRLPGSDITPEGLRRRDWWSGPELFVLVDDFELLVGPDNPLLPLVPFLSHGADIGLHVVLARGAANGMRTSVDPVLRRIQDSNNPDIALSCPPSEGPLLGGARGRVLPPGRALLCTRRGHQLIQTPWSDPAAGRS